MDAKRVLEMLSDGDIFDLLSDLDAEPIDKGNAYECRTVCHGGHKHKLIIYKDSKQSHCYTNCGQMSLFDLIAKVKNCEFIDALRFIVKRFNLREDDHTEGFNFYQVENPGDLYRQKTQKILMPEFEKLDTEILDYFYPYYHKLWIEDGISIRTMKKYGIKFDIMNNQIIIPHYDEDGALIGIRGRNLNKEMVDEGKKYMPIFYDGKVLKHLTGANLYGLNMNKKMIEEYGVAILFESEKSVLQLDSMLPDQSVGLCISGSSLTNYQLEILKKMNIREIVIGVDKEFVDPYSEKAKIYAKKIEKVFRDKLAPYFTVSIMWDTENLLNEKDSPTDQGLSVFNELFKNRIYI